MTESWMTQDPIIWRLFETTFFPFVVVLLSMWSLTAPIGLVNSLASANEFSGYFWRILAPEQCYMRTPFTTGEGSYS